MIYFWNINRLKSDLVNRPISNTQALIYLALILSVQIASWLFSFFAGGELNLWDKTDLAGFFLFLVIGAAYCRHANGGGNGVNFLSRYISLAWVFGMQYFIMVVMPLSLVLYLIFSLFVELPETTQWYDALFNAVVRLPFYLVLAGHLRDVALKKVLTEQEISEQEEEYDREFDCSRYPGILRRYAATSIDLIFVLYSLTFLCAVLQHCNGIRPDGMIRFGILILFFYDPVFTSRYCTIGQKVMGIRVRGLDSGQRLSMAAACLRSVVKLVMGIISFFSIPVTRKRRALHDFVAGSVVIYEGEE